jgi:predicted nicotinamide N-methyase
VFGGGVEQHDALVGGLVSLRWMSSADSPAVEPAWRRLNKSHKDKFELDFRLEIAGAEMVIKQAYAWASVDTVGLTVWDASLVLAKYLELRGCEALKDLFVVELGAGCGVAGIAAAMLGARVMLTDWEIVMPLLRQNAELNSPICRHSISTRLLRWTRSEDLQGLEGKADLIIGSDLFYQRESIPPLLRTIRTLASSTTEILLSYEAHNEVHMEFWAQAPAFFSVSIIPASEQHPIYRHPNVQLLRLTPLSPDNPV